MGMEQQHWQGTRQMGAESRRNTSRASLRPSGKIFFILFYTPLTIITYSYYTATTHHFHLCCQDQHQTNGTSRFVPLVEFFFVFYDYFITINVYRHYAATTTLRYHHQHQHQTDDRGLERRDATSLQTLLLVSNLLLIAVSMGLWLMYHFSFVHVLCTTTTRMITMLYVIAKKL